MSQEDILKVLKKSKKWWSSKQLANFLNSKRGKILRQCNKLVQYGLLEIKEIQKGGLREFYWRHKHGNHK